MFLYTLSSFLLTQSSFSYSKLFFAFMVPWSLKITKQFSVCTVTQWNIKLQTIQYRRTRIWEIKKDKYTKTLAKNQVCEIFQMRDIGKNGPGCAVGKKSQKTGSSRKNIGERSRRPFPLPRLPLGSIRSLIFFCRPRRFVSFFPQCGAWSQAN